MPVPLNPAHGEITSRHPMTSQEKKLPQSTAGVLPRVCSMGISMWDPIYARRFHASREHEFIHVMEGETVIHLRKEKVKATSGDTLFLRKSTIHRDEFLREPAFKVFHVMFQWDEYDVILSRDINAKLVRVPAIEKQKIREMVMDMYGLFRADRPFAREMINASLYNVLLYCAGIVNAGHGQRGSGKLAEEKLYAFIEKAKQYIRDHFNRPISLSDIADHLSLSEYYVSHIFSEETGITFSSYVTQLRMERAAELLRDMKKNISDVAYRVGYENQAYFGKVFYKYFNCTPSRYQARVLKASRQKQSSMSFK